MYVFLTSNWVLGEGEQVKCFVKNKSFAHLQPEPSRLMSNWVLGEGEQVKCFVNFKNKSFAHLQPGPVFFLRFREKVPKKTAASRPKKSSKKSSKKNVGRFAADFLQKKTTKTSK